MVKKQKEETPNINATPNRDIIQRLNFLYQASVYLQSLEPSISDKAKEIHDSKHTQNVGGTKKKKKKHKRKQRTGDLARSYVQCMRVVGQKTTVKIDPALKRSLCSSCDTTLIPGSSASVRVKKSSSHGHLVIYTCLHCKSSKGIPAPPTLDVAAGTESSSILTDVRGSPGYGSLGFPTMAHPSQSQVQKEEKTRTRRKKKTTRSRLLPLSARPDAGHVVFKGNEVLNQEGGLGVCFI